MDEKTDHDLLIRLDEKVDVILKKQDKFEENYKDHAKRLNKLEGFRGQIIGFAAAMSFGISFLVSKLGSMFGGN
jgi:hypothetical protein